MSADEGKKVRGNQKGKKGKGSGPSDPLAAVRAHVPKVSAKENTKSASHTQAAGKKGVSHTQVESTKGVSSTLVSGGKRTVNSPHLSPAEIKKGTSNTPVSNLTKV